MDPALVMAAIVNRDSLYCQRNSDEHHLNCGDRLL